MVEEEEIIRCLEQLHGGRRTSTEASFTSPLIAIIEHNVYSSNPENLPLQSDGMEETQKKKYYCTPLRYRGAAAAAGIARVTPDGRWKARDGAMAIMLTAGGDIRFKPWKTGGDEPMSMEVEGGGAIIGFKKKFEYRKGRNPEQNTKWEMIEYTLHPPESGQENRYALCYVYKTKQDGRQRNGNGNVRVNEQQPTNHYVGGSSTSASAIAVEGSSPFELFEIPEEFQFEIPEEFLQFEIPEEFQFETPEEQDVFVNAPLWSWNI